MIANPAARSHITTHVLDTGIGGPAVGVRATLEAKTASGWIEIGSGVADADGRIAMLGPARVDAGHHRITFDTGHYFEQTGTKAFFPVVSVDFLVSDTADHYHVPLLISPFAYSTYRGS